jgi:hypothetical protein
MSPEQQRIAIAEACGWTFCEGLTGRPPKKGYAYIPDYLNSLDAMHEAEKVLKGVQPEDYWGEVAHLVPDTKGMFGILHATAAQRAEAFLRTLNLWKP